MMWQDFTLVDVVGVVGSLLICMAYLGVSLRRVAPDGLAYQGANALGAAMLLVSLYFRPNPGAIVIEAVWLTIALFAIGRLLLGRR